MKKKTKTTKRRTTRAPARPKGVPLAKWRRMTKADKRRVAKGVKMLQRLIDDLS